ncbi:hypothetical protein ES703_72449 [subsurface metagenome]
MAIDIGLPAEDRNSLMVAGWTAISKDNPANASGTITSIEIWAAIDIEGLRVGTFYTTNGDTLKCRDSETIPGTITAGSKITKAISIAVEAGDYIGCYFTAGKLERSSAGYAGVWSISSEQIDPDDEAVYGTWAGDTLSLYGTGTEVGGETHYGAATLSGVGTLAGIGRGIFVGKSTLSGTGTLSSVGRLIAVGKAALSGIGSLTAAGTIEAIKYGAATLSGVGSLAAKGVGIFAGKATLTGAGSLVAVGRGIFAGSATLAGTGTLAVIGSIVAVGIQDKSPGMAAKLVARKLI